MGSSGVTGSIDNAGTINFSYIIPAGNELEYTGTAVQQPGGEITMSGTWCILALPADGTGCELAGNWLGSTTTYPYPGPPN